MQYPRRAFFTGAALGLLLFSACRPPASTPSRSSPGGSGGSSPVVSTSSSDSTEPVGGIPSGGSSSGGATTSGALTGGIGGTSVSTGTGGSTGMGRPSLPKDRVMTCDTPVRAVSTQHVEAECAFGPSKGKCNGTSGGQQGTQLENVEANVSYYEGGDLLYYADVELDGVDTLRLRYAKGVEGGKVEVRLDSASGPLVGTWTPAVTNSWATWADATVALSPSTGVHSVYLVAVGTTAGIANLDWLEFSAGAANTGPTFKVHLNNLGFDTQGAKHAVIEGPAGLKRFHVVASDGTAVWCGDLEPQGFDAWGSSQTFYSVDFSELTRPGTYRLQVEGTASPKFEIADHRLLDKTLSAVLGYFKASRADDADVWAADAGVPLIGTGQRLDVRGGWYDASGDISKYLTHLSYANFLNPQQIPLVAWALAWVHDHGALSSADAAAAQAEALWGADFLMRMLDPTGFFYITVFDHWSGNMGSREICAFDGEYGGSSDKYQSALREGGGMSIAALAAAARWKVDGDFTSAQYLAGAEKAFAHLNANGQQYCDDGKENVIDDYAGLLAAVELYATNHNKDVLDAARARATSLIGRLGADGCFIADGAARPFWHASDAGLPAVALARYLQVETDMVRKLAASAALRKHLDYQLQITSAVTNPFGYARQTTGPARTGFFIPHDNETGYWWQGENARLASLASAALMGGDVLGATGTQYLDLLRFAGWQLDWILGANPYDICFLHGFGDKNPPAYSSSKMQAGTLAGGIANGITGKEKDGSGIQWPTDNFGWRWVEQWIPHAAWYLVAVTALAR